VVHWVFHRVGDGACCRYFPSRFNDVASLFIFHERISKRPLKRFVESLDRWRSIRFTAQLILENFFLIRVLPKWCFHFTAHFRLFSSIGTWHTWKRPSLCNGRSLGWLWLLYVNLIKSFKMFLRTCALFVFGFKLDST